MKIVTDDNDRVYQAGEYAAVFIYVILQAIIHTTALVFATYLTYN